ncbi:MAG: nucleoside monophosphate kinase [Candidatus Paceibacterota bacterium]
MNPQTFIFIGNSGCGKGTQAEFLKAYLKEKDTAVRPVFHLESGEKFREFIKEKGYTSELSAKIYSRKERQPDFLAIWLAADVMIKNFKGDEHLIIDGVARSLIEAESFDSALSFYGRKANVIYPRVSREWSRKHLMSRGRSDDSPEGIETRLGWFDTDVVPAIEYYRNNPNYNFIEVDGEQGREKVFADIKEKLILY